MKKVNTADGPVVKKLSTKLYRRYNYPQVTFYFTTA